MGSVYPAEGRSAWIVSRRPPRPAAPDPDQPRGVFLEEEYVGSGRVAATGVILLTNRECPWKCLMCDLWKETTTESVPSGSIPRQIRAALARWPVPPPEQVKLYNSGSFFDPGAIEPGDYPDIARLVSFAQNIVVESHPRLAGPRALRLRDLLKGTLEVAMGLETAEPDALAKLNKGFDLDDFERAVRFLRGEGIGVRAFVLVPAPFLDRTAGVEWAVRSAAFAFSCGAGAVSLIATRTGNGAMEPLQASGEVFLPGLADLERAQAGALALGLGRVFADTWGVECLATCPGCAAARLERLRRINRSQRCEPAVECARCRGA